jgi:predicted PhzF superfamily epimerase YddE/YHI9
VQRNGELLSLDFPSLTVAPAVVPGVVAALGAQPRETLRSNSLLAVFESEDEVRAIRPNLERVAALGDWMVIVTAQGKDVDYVFRVFAPGAGIPEDPATGSAHCSLIPYWASRLGKSNFSARQISTRVGDFTCELHGSRVRISGMAVEYLQGEIHVD